MATDALTPLDAAREIHRLEGMDLMLRRRTTGLVWMVWGIVAPAIFVTYGFVAAAWTAGGTEHWLGLLWIPWAALGMATSALLWRSARAVAPRAGPARPSEIVLHVALFLGVPVLGIAILLGVHAAIEPPAIYLGGLGIACMILGAFGILAVDGVDRAVRATVGAFLVVVATVASLALGGASPLEARESLAIVGALATCVAFFGSGFALVLRG